MTYFIKRGTALLPSPHAEIVDVIHPGTFMVARDAEGNYFLEQTDDLTLNTDKLYGDVAARASRIIETFRARGNVGVLMSGSKGSGKSLLARLVSAECRAVGTPTIVVADMHKGDGFNALLKSIEQPHVLLIDEFDKVYAKAEDQNSLLSILDGINSAQRLTLVTLNDVDKVSDFFKNRPGRFFYRFDYIGLDESFIREYCLDKLVVKGMTDEVVRYSKVFNDFNFDILKALVEEMNRYGETVEQAAQFLNARPEADTSTFEAIDFTLKKASYEADSVYVYNPCNPIVGPVRIDVADETGDREQGIVLRPRDIVSMGGGRFTYDNPKITVTLVKVGRQKPISYRDLL